MNCRFKRGVKAALVILLCLFSFTKTSHAENEPNELVVPEIFTDILNRSEVVLMRAEKGAIFVIWDREKGRRTIQLKICGDTQEAKAGFQKIANIPTVMPFTTSLQFADEGMAWKSQGRPGGSLVFRRGLAVVSMSGGFVDLNEILKMARILDKKLASSEPDSIAKQFEALNRTWYKRSNP